MGVKVSVVMSVHNPGADADAGIRSVLEQTLPPDEYEVIFADDGSAAEFAERLDTVAGSRPNVRVLHLPRSGSPMRGRNAGMTDARGEYVYLLDQGDRLERDALALMYERAVIADADVLVGRLVGDEGPPPVAFQVNRERAELLRDRLLTQLTPHKLYRRDFLADQGLCFDDDGGVVAEETFVIRAYLAAKVVAVLADRVCCRLAPPPNDIQDPVRAALELDDLLDVVDEHTPPGRQRDRMYAHWFRTVVLRPFAGGRFLIASQDRSVIYRTMRELATRRFPPRLDPLLPVHLRAVAALLRAGRLDQLIILAGVTRGVRLRTDVHEACWDGGALALRLDAELVQTDGSPMWFRARDDRLYWIPPTPIDPKVLPLEMTEVGEAVAKARLHVYVRHTETGEKHVLPTTTEVAVRGDGPDVRILLAAEARLDASTAAVGHPLAVGMWEVHAHLYGGAYHARARVRGSRTPLNCAGAVADYPRRLVVPCCSDEGALGVCVDPATFADSVALVSPGTTTIRRDDHVFVVVPVPYVPPSGGPPVELALRCGTREVFAPGLVEPGEPGRLAGQLVAKLPVRRMPAAGVLSPGVWTASLRAEGRDVPLRFVVQVARGQIEARPASAAERVAEPYPSLLRRVAARLPGARRAARLARRSRY